NALTSAGEGYPFALCEQADRLVIDCREAIAAVVHDVWRGAPIGALAARFHATIAHMTQEVCEALRDRYHVADVGLTGGVFCNAVLVELTTSRLEGAGFRVHRHRFVPPNDGGLCLGQLAVAAARDREDVR